MHIHQQLARINNFGHPDSLGNYFPEDMNVLADIKRRKLSWDGRWVLRKLDVIVLQK